MKTHIRIVAVVLLLLIVLAGCAPGPNALRDQPDAEGDVAGFWNGLWHGVIAPVTFVISLFSNTVTMYDVNNNGGWYNFGFLFGVMMIFGGGGGGAAHSRRRY
ncbi:MAG: hypothetical protein ACOC1U_00890 [Spirochaetota bacterium]